MNVTGNRVVHGHSGIGWVAIVKFEEECEVVRIWCLIKDFLTYFKLILGLASYSFTGLILKGPTPKKTRDQRKIQADQKWEPHKILRSNPLNSGSKFYQNIRIRILNSGSDFYTLDPYRNTVFQARTGCRTKLFLPAAVVWFENIDFNRIRAYNCT